MAIGIDASQRDLVELRTHELQVVRRVFWRQAKSASDPRNDARDREVASKAWELFSICDAELASRGVDAEVWPQEVQAVHLSPAMQAKVARGDVRMQYLVQP